MNNVADILVPYPIDKLYTYKLTAGEKEGDIVRILFNNTSLWGVIWNIRATKENKLKEIIQPSGFNIGKDYIQIIQKISHHLIQPLGTVYKHIFPFQKYKQFREYNSQPVYATTTLCYLSAEQKKAAQQIIDHQKICLLEGVAGSGKTETYFHCIQDAINKGLKSLVLLPEIILTIQWKKRFKKYFGYYPLEWNSSMGIKEKLSNWIKINSSNEPLVIVGTRSAIFLPIKKLGLIIIDEEHDISYKQEQRTIYHAKDIATIISKQKEIPLILSSATPSLESLFQVQQKEYKHIKLEKRYRSVLPTIKIIEAEKKSYISEELIESIKKNNTKQTLLFINRRGYAPILICSNCNYRFHCNNCTNWLVVHKKAKILLCHKCNFTMALPKICIKCLSAKLVKYGPGVEKIQEEINTKLPDYTTLIVSSDIIKSPIRFEQTIKLLENNKINIIIGTQLLAKGHHFPNITLVGIIDADMGLYNGDLRAQERTYQLIQQVCGRCGREQAKGKVLIQTHYPKSSIILALAGQKDFLTEELKNRKTSFLPPYSRLFSIIITGYKEQEVINAASILSTSFPSDQEITLMGPAPAIAYKVQKKYTWRILLQIPIEKTIYTEIKEWLAKKQFPYVQIKIDTNPYCFN